MKRWRRYSWIAIALGVAASGLAASEANGTSASAGYDPDGVLRVATSLDQFALEVGEVHGFGSINHFGMAYHVFGAPLRLAEDGTYEPFLAEAYEVVDAHTVDLTLRDGLTFHDGAPYDAQTLADAMLAYQEMDTQAFGAYPLEELTSIDVDSETELTFHLDAPVAGLWLDALSNAPAVIASPGSSPDAPAGAGPYRIVDYVAEDHLFVERWDDFFAVDEFLLAGVEWYNIPQIEAAQNALESGQVDLISTTPRDVDALSQRGPFESLITNNQGHLMIATCRSAEPFDDPAFREAFDLALNREQLNQLAYGGHAQVMAGLWNPSSPFAVPELIDGDGDPERARELLDEIGWDSSQAVRVGVYPGIQTQILVAEAVQGQLAEVGVTLEIVPMETFVFSDYVNSDVGGTIVLGNINPGPQGVAVPGVPPANHWNPCGDGDDLLNELIAPLVGGTAADEELEETWRAVQEHVIGNHLWFPLTTQPFAYAYNAERVQGLQPGAVSLSGATMPSPHLAGVSIIGE